MRALSSLQPEQSFAVDNLIAAVAAERLHHAYLLAGPEEAGGDTLALAVAASLVCEERKDADACLTCAACRKLAGGNHPDVIHVLPDEKGKIAIDTVRHISNRLSLRAAQAATKVAIIEQADRMAGPAQNALLKTLEEPPGACCFLLTTTRVRSLLPTVRSRCQTLRLAPKPRRGAWKVLVEGGVDDTTAKALAALVGPDTERATGLVDGGAAEITERIARALASETSPAALLEIAADLGSDRERSELALHLLEVHVRDLLAKRFGADKEHLFTEPGNDDSLFLADAASELQRLRRLRAFNVNRTLALETVLLKLRGHLTEGSSR